MQKKIWIELGSSAKTYCWVLNTGEIKFREFRAPKKIFQSGVTFPAWMGVDKTYATFFYGLVAFIWLMVIWREGEGQLRTRPLSFKFDNRLASSRWQFWSQIFLREHFLASFEFGMLNIPFSPTNLQDGKQQIFILIFEDKTQKPKYIFLF